VSAAVPLERHEGAVLCLVEHDRGILDASLRALSLARALAESSEDDLLAAVVGPIEDAFLETLENYGVREVFVLSIEGLEDFAPVAWASALGSLALELGANGLLAAGTDRGNEVLAHIAALHNLPMEANCLSATRLSPTSVRLSRQRWAGSLIEESVLEGPPPLLTVAFDGVEATPRATNEPFARTEYRYQPNEGDLAVRAAEWRGRGGGVSLADARVVVGGGRGVGSEEGFAALDELAGLLGAAVGVSRVVTSLGWRPHVQQVGQTGTRISPELYLACGISGATQHLAGCRSAKRLITINTDSDAPILSRADYAIVGDITVVLPALTAAIKARKAKS
jgi:electron transfer flavoprotein alpha subunit